MKSLVLGVLLMLSTQLSQASPLCSSLLLSSKTYPQSLIDSPTESYNNWKERIEKGDQFPEFHTSLQKMQTELQKVIKSETDPAILAQIYQPLAQEISQALTHSIQYFPYLNLVAKFATAMDIQLKNVESPELKALHAEIAKHKAMGINTTNFELTYPPMDPHQRMSWYQQRIKWVLTTHPGSPQDIQKQFIKAKDSVFIQLPMLQPLDFIPFLKLWIEGFSPVWISFSHTFEGWTGSTMTHDWRHGIGQSVFDAPTKTKLRSLISKIEKLPENEFRNAAQLIVFDVLHERIINGQPHFSLAEKSDIVEDVMLTNQSSGYGEEMHTKLQSFAKSQWEEVYNWINQNF
ncbi:MAG: hypothetical protein ACXVBQ_17050 [Pseudobdellovibrionaceae bacterium]